MIEQHRGIRGRFAYKDIIAGIKYHIRHERMDEIHFHVSHCPIYALNAVLC